MLRHTVLWCLGMGCLALALVMPHSFVAPRAWDVARAETKTATPAGPDLTSLNVRLSQRAIHAPEPLIKEVVALPHVQAARARIAPSPKAAILEDDNHNRALILSVLDDGRLEVQVLADLDFAPHVPFVAACAEGRGCAYDRRPVTGGLGCVAICIQQALDPSRQP